LRIFHLTRPRQAAFDACKAGWAAALTSRSQDRKRRNGEDFHLHSLLPIGSASASRVPSAMASDGN
jgi:hypothetical protein